MCRGAASQKTHVMVDMARRQYESIAKTMSGARLKRSPDAESQKHRAGWFWPPVRAPLPRQRMRIGVESSRYRELHPARAMDTPNRVATARRKSPRIRIEVLFGGAWAAINENRQNQPCQALITFSRTTEDRNEVRPPNFGHHLLDCGVLGAILAEDGASTSNGIQGHYAPSALQTPPEEVKQPS